MTNDRPMSVTYIRRFRLEINLTNARLQEPVLPDGYLWTRWQPGLLDRHAAVKYESFRFEMDSRIFPCLGDPVGCQRLMKEICSQQTFLPHATWLVRHRPPALSPRGDNPVAGRLTKQMATVDCGTIQGLIPSRFVGAIQNVGVVPAHRGMGLGRALVLKALHGFQAAGVRRVYLEVTAENAPAVELYRSIGFRLARTMYKAVELETVAG